MTHKIVGNDEFKEGERHQSAAMPSSEDVERERDQWRANFEQLSARNLEMAERHSEHLHRAALRAEAAEAKVARAESLVDEWNALIGDGSTPAQRTLSEAAEQLRAALNWDDQ